METKTNKLLVFSSYDYDVTAFEKYPEKGLELEYVKETLTPDILRKHAKKGEYVGIIVFVNDQVDKEVIDIMAENDMYFIATRSAGFNHIDLAYAKEKNMKVYRVPEYSSYSIAEHAVTLLLSSIRDIPTAVYNTRHNDFSLKPTMMGFDIHGKTVGLVGTGKIGQKFAQIMAGFGATVIAYDKFPATEWAEKFGVTYVELDELYAKADIIALFCPVFPETQHMINKDSIAKMKDGVIIINTARGLLVKTEDMVDALKSGKVARYGADVYENEAKYFFNDYSNIPVEDKVLEELLAQPHAMITPHSAFFTNEAFENIYKITMANVMDGIDSKENAREMTQTV
ncbi:NAD(P)-dependent oxidoreductase [Vagococcus vulneris]|nr:NAD(P)-dependent oxidoreductase [Vagococcus vulneris]